MGNLKKYSFVKGFLSKGILEVGSRKVACFDSRKKKTKKGANLRRILESGKKKRRDFVFDFVFCCFD